MGTGMNTGTGMGTGTYSLFTPSSTSVGPDHEMSVCANKYAGPWRRQSPVAFNVAAFTRL